MKKMFTLIALVTLTASAFAQQDRRNQKSHDYDDQKNYGYKANGNRHDNNHWKNSYSFSLRERDMQIAQINREYNQKIQSVQNKIFMNYFKKQKMIRALEDKRNSQIRIVYAKFNNPRNRFDDRYSKRY